MSEHAPRRLVIHESSDSSVASLGSSDEDLASVEDVDVDVDAATSPAKSKSDAVDAITEGLTHVTIHKDQVPVRLEDEDDEDDERQAGYEGDSDADALMDTDTESVTKPAPQIRKFTSKPPHGDLVDSDSESESEASEAKKASIVKRRTAKKLRPKGLDDLDFSDAESKIVPAKKSSRSAQSNKNVDDDDNWLSDSVSRNDDEASLLSAQEDDDSELVYDSESDFESADDNHVSDEDDFLDDDFEVPKAKPRRRAKPAELLSSSDESESDDDSVANEEKCDKLWSYKKETKEYYLSSSDSINMPKLCVPASLYKKLYEHQRIGVAWMASMYNRKVDNRSCGGLLGDDMGMGKTFTTLTYIAGLMRAKTIVSALVVAPVSVLRSWENEAERIVRSSVRSVSILVVNSTGTKKAREKKLKAALESTPARPTLIIATYGLIMSTPEYFIHDTKAWGVCVGDEAQTIKNHKSKVSKNLRLVCHSANTRRLLLTGTPIMNRLPELWALFDFCCSGKLLGTINKFTMNYAKPIEGARDRLASKYAIAEGNKANSALQRKLKPFFLQRMKADILAHMLPPKHDLVVWTHISDKQRALYEEYISAKDSAVASVLAGDVKSPLAAITWLKKLCAHPVLVENQPDEEGGPISLDNIDPKELIEQSSKLQVLAALVDKLTAQKHKILIFSMSTKMLDIIEKILFQYSISRIDGSTKEKDRQVRVDDFNSPNGDIDIMLLSTKAAGVGLTLTGADRVILADISWTPSEDAQSVDRCYRIGQKKSVMVFRLISGGTIEEKMYDRQIHKDGISRTVLTKQGNATARHYDSMELRALFRLSEPGVCAALERFRKNGQGASALDTNGFLSAHDGVVGISAHDGIYAEADLAALLSEGSDLAAQLPTENPFGGSQDLFSDELAIKLLEENNDENDNPNKSHGAPAPMVAGKSQRALQNLGNHTVAPNGVPACKPYNPSTKPTSAAQPSKPNNSIQPINLINPTARGAALKLPDHTITDSP